MRRTIKRVYLSFYQAVNFGDDLFLHILCERYPRVRFLIRPTQYLETYHGLGIRNLVTHFRLHRLRTELIGRQTQKASLFGRIRNFALWQIIKRIDALLARSNDRQEIQITMAGSSFAEPDEWKPDGKVYFPMLRQSIPYYIVNPNFGPYASDSFLEACRALFAKAGQVSFRDRYSAALFADCAHAFYAPDVVFSAQFAQTPQATDGGVLISVIDFSLTGTNRRGLSAYRAAYEQKIAQICGRYQDMGVPVTLASFCRAEGDEDAVGRILALLPEAQRGQIRTVFYDGDIPRMLRCIAGASFIVATRFHAMILGWYFGKSVFPIVYNRKMLHCIEDVGFAGKYCLAENIDALAFEDLEYNRTADVLVDAETQKRSAQKHFEILDTILKQ